MSLVITTSGPNVEGEVYSLICELVGAEQEDVSEPRFRWDKVGGREGIVHLATLTFNPLTPGDAGEYMCTHTFQLSYLTGTRTITARKTVTVNPPTTAVPPTTATTPPPLVVMISGNSGQLTAGENHMLTCQVTGGGTMTPTYRWLRNGTVMTSETSATLSFSPLRETNAGVYVCEATRRSMTMASAISVVGKL